MALSKTIPQKAGVDATYHRISGVTIDFNAKQMVVQVSSYLDQAVRENDSSGLLNLTTFSFNAEAWPLSSSGETLTDIYNSIKTLEPFQGSIDV